MIKYVITTFICIVIMSCNFFDKNTQKYRKIALEWHNRQIILPTRLPDKGICCDTLYPVLTTKKYKIFTYIDTLGCTACNFGALAWKQLIHEADSLNYDVAFLFYAHLKNYEEFETYLEINKFIYPIFYDYKGECNKQNKLPQHVFYQTFLLDENNKVLLIGKPTPGSNLWNLYKKIISQ